MPELAMGGPWLGYNDAVKRHEIDPSEMAADSENIELSTLRGKLLKRRGMLSLSTAVGENNYVYSAGPPVTEGYRFRGDFVQEVYTETLRRAAGATGYPTTVGILFTAEDDPTNSYAFFWYWDPTTSPFNRRICDQINSSLYPTANGVPTQACLPTNDIAGPRFLSADDRARHAIGSRSFLSVADHTYFPCWGDREYNGTAEWGLPHRWNNIHPTGYPTYGQVERVRPTGHQPPMWIPRITAKTAAAANQPAPWSDADAFFISVLYEWQDGSLSRPALPRSVEVNGIRLAANSAQRYSGLGANMGGVGFIRLNTAGSATYGSITWSGIPVGPEGVVRVWLLRTQKVQATAAGVLTTIPDLATLGVVTKLPNGTTTYEDPDGFDSANFPLADADLVRVGGEDTWPLRARWMWTFDGRVAIGDLRMSPAAVLICCVDGQAGYNFDFNAADNTIAHYNTTLGSEWRYKSWVRICTDSIGNRALYLYCRDYNGGAPIVYIRRIVLTGITLQQLVDSINCASSGAAAFGNWTYNEGGVGKVGETTTVWAAQLAPGVDGSIAATDLADTFVGGSAYGDSVPNGGVRQIGTLTATEASNIVHTNVMRVYGPGMPGVLQFSSSYLRAQPRLPAGIQFTEGGSLQPTLAPNSYLVKNYREGTTDVGRCMGGSGLDDGSLVCFSNAVGVLRNFKDGKSGFDDDYLLVIRWRGINVISGVAEGPGFGVFLTNLGLVASDGDDHILISEKLYNASLKTGILAYEVSEGLKAQALRNHGDYFHCCVDRGRIYISFRSSASVTRPDRFMFMDFSPGKDQRGLASLIDPTTGKVFGWSAPFKPADTLSDRESQAAIAPGAMGVFRDPATGTVMLVGTRDNHINATKDGNVWTLDTGVLDGATAYGWTLFGRTNTAPIGTKKIRAQRVVIRYYDTDGVLTVSHARSARAHTANPGFFTTSPTLTVSNANESFTEYEWELPLPTRGLTEATEIKIVAAASGSGRPELFGLAYYFEVVDPKEGS